MLILKSVCFQFKVIQLAGHEVNGDLEGASSQSLAEGATVQLSCAEEGFDEFPEEYYVSAR